MFKIEMQRHKDEGTDGDWFYHLTIWDDKENYIHFTLSEDDLSTLHDNVYEIMKTGNDQISQFEQEIS